MGAPLVTSHEIVWHDDDVPAAHRDTWTTVEV
eukprot:COSAG01_NODE_53717_length_337_cov_0.773109_1_plen_31_part_01